MTIPTMLQPVVSFAPSPMGAASAAALAAPGAPDSARSIAGFSMQHQQQTEWCWAAVSASVSDLWDAPSPWLQCRIAAAELSPLNCCGADAGGGCNVPGYLDKALARVGHFARMDCGNAPFVSVQSEINASRPLGCRIAWEGGGAHFVALSGWRIVNGAVYVDVNDPIYGALTKTYDDFVSAYQTAGDSWTHSYYTQSAAQAVAGGGPAMPQVSPLSA